MSMLMSIKCIRSIQRTKREMIKDEWSSILDQKGWLVLSCHLRCGHSRQWSPPKVVFAGSKKTNNARGTTDPEYCIHFSCRDNSSYRLNTLGPLCLWQCFIPMYNNPICSKGLVRWHHLHWFLFWQPGGTNRIGCQCGHQMALLVLVVDLANSWRFLN